MGSGGLIGLGFKCDGVMGVKYKSIPFALFCGALIVVLLLRVLNISI